MEGTSDCIVAGNLHYLPLSSSKYSNEPFPSENYLKTEVPILKRSKISPFLFLTQILPYHIKASLFSRIPAFIMR